MDDEQTNVNVEEVVEDQSQPTEAPAGQVAEEASQDTTEEAPEEQAQEESEEEAPEEKPISRREQTRVQALLAKYGPPPERNQAAPSQRTDALNYSQALDADPEVIQRLEDDRRANGQASYNEGLRRAEAIEFKTNIRLDLPLVTEKLQKLDPRDAEALDREYLYTVGFDPSTGYVQNPNIGYAEFIEAKVELAERMAASMNAQTVRNVARQTAQTGLRPDGSSAKRMNLNQAPENMTNEELYAVLGQKPPKK